MKNEAGAWSVPCLGMSLGGTGHFSLTLQGSMPTAMCFLAVHFAFCLRLCVFSVTGLSDEEDQKPVRLPLKVPVELQPRNNHAWARVQSLAQNPRLRYPGPAACTGLQGTCQYPSGTFLCLR